MPTHHGVFKTGTFNIADHTATSNTIDPYTGWSLVAAPCKNSHYCFVGTATDDVIHGRISDLHGHVIYYVDSFVAYSRKHGKRVPYIAPGSTVIRR